MDEIRCTYSISATVSLSGSGLRHRIHAIYASAGAAATATAVVHFQGVCGASIEPDT